MPGPVLDPPTVFESWSLVDWIEKTILFEDLDRISRAEILRRLGVDQPDFVELDQTFDEVRRRRQIAPGSYPLAVADDGTIELDGRVDPRVYWFLLLLAQVPAPYRDLDEFTRIAPAFDLLSREALKAYLGWGSHAMRFGVPVTDGRATSLARALEGLAKAIGRDVISLKKVRSTDQDGGVDVVGWKPLASGGKIFPVHLVQCTVQRNFKRKPSDITPWMWMEFIDFGTPPAIGLTVPFALAPTATQHRDVNWRADLFLDRFGLCEHLETSALAAYEPEWGFMTAWVAEERERELKALVEPSVAGNARRKRPRRPAPTKN